MPAWQFISSASALYSWEAWQMVLGDPKMTGVSTVSALKKTHILDDLWSPHFQEPTFFAGYNLITFAEMVAMRLPKMFIMVLYPICTMRFSWKSHSRTVDCCRRPRNSEPSTPDLCTGLSVRTSHCASAEDRSSFAEHCFRNHRNGNSDGTDFLFENDNDGNDNNDNDGIRWQW